MAFPELAFYVGVGVVFALAATRGFHAWFKDQIADIAIIYTMLSVLSIFVLLNYD